MSDEGKLGLLAGAGALPKLIIAEAARRNRPIFVVGFSGHVDPAILENTPHIFARPGRAGAILRALRHENVTDLVMAGGIRRPSLAELRPDWYAARFLARLGRSMLGDDGLLSAVARQFEAEGFRVVGAADLIGSLTFPAGALGAVAPTEDQRAGIALGIEVVRTLGRLDVGQAAVVQQGLVLGVEGLEGTDALIARCGALARAGDSPVLVKLAKPQQDTRVDLPTIGESTITALSAAGFGGVAIEAHRTQILDAPATIALADRHGLFLSAVEVT